MKPILFSFLMLFVLASCSPKQQDSFKTQVVDTLSSAGAEGIASVLTCEGKDAIKDDVSEKLGELKVFQTNQKSTASMLCTVAVSAVLPEVLGVGLNQVPATWGCSGVSVSMSLSDFAQSLCDRVK
jgi:hypothetical protein